MGCLLFSSLNIKKRAMGLHEQIQPVTEHTGTGNVEKIEQLVE
jgi:hypothetical protein